MEDGAQESMKALRKSETENCQASVKRKLIQIRMIDLNLFRVFDAMMRHRNVREASRILSVTPSAVSHALRRLRQSLHDELFVSSESGMQPTQHALEMAPAIREGLEKLESALVGKEPARAEALRTFRVVATDYASMVIVPPLAKRLVGSAPHVALQVVACYQSNLRQYLRGEQYDLILGSFEKLQTGLRRSTLIWEDEVVVVRTGHPLTRKEMTKEQLLEFPRVVVEPTQAEEIQPDGLMCEAGSPPSALSGSALREFPDETAHPTGRPAVSVPHFAAVVPLLQVTDLVAILPRRFARLTALNAPIVLLELPYPSTKMKIEMVWHQRADQDPGLRWLSNEVIESIWDVE